MEERRLRDQVYYLIREDAEWKYTISKWDGGVWPIGEYVLHYDRNKKLHCNCPSGRYRGYCKHKDILKRWISAGKPEGKELE